MTLAIGRIVVFVMMSFVTACSTGTGGGTLDGGAEGGAQGDTAGGVVANGTCESLCTHLSATKCTTATEVQTKDACLTMCSAWVTAAGAKCASQAAAYNTCCTKADLTVKCRESNLRARDCDDGDVCASAADAMYACCGYTDGGASLCAPIQ